MKKNTMTLMGLGGMGTNAVMHYLDGRKSMEGYAEIEPVLIDTSFSNIDERHKEHFVRISGAKEGSGALRSENMTAVRDEVKDILLNHPPKDVVVLVSSMSGGSGSIISDAIAVELATKGIPFICIRVVDTSSEIRVSNAISAMKTMQTFAERTKTPFVMLPVANDSRRDADNQVQHAISSLALLFSNEHLELDNADLANFLNYTRVTKSSPSLVELRIFNTRDKDWKEQVDPRPISLAMVHGGIEAQETTNGLFVTSYSCEGFLRNSGEGENTASVVYEINNDGINELVKYLDGKIGEFKDQASAAAVKTTISTSNHDATADEDGFFC